MLLHACFVTVYVRAPTSVRPCLRVSMRMSIQHTVTVPVMHGLIGESGGVGAFGGWRGSGGRGGGSGEVVIEAVCVRSVSRSGVSGDGTV